MDNTTSHNNVHVQSPLKLHSVNKQDLYIHLCNTYYSASGCIFYIHALYVACASFLPEEAGPNQQQQQLPPVLSYHEVLDLVSIQVKTDLYLNTHCTDNIRTRYYFNFLLYFLHYK